MPKEVVQCLPYFQDKYGLFHLDSDLIAGFKKCVTKISQLRSLSAIYCTKQNAELADVVQTHRGALLGFGLVKHYSKVNHK